MTDALRTGFSGYFPLASDVVNAAWKTGLVAFDANILLNLYRFPPEALRRFFEIMERLGSRVWIPHQAAEEYHRHRQQKIAEQRDAYGAVAKVLAGMQRQLDSMRSEYEQHPHLSVEEVAQAVRDGIETARERLKQATASHEDRTKRDPVLERLTQLLGSRVGQPYRGEDLERAYDEAERRFRRRVPPGYEDEGKGGSRQYGDVLVWLQLVDYARQAKQPVVLVTDDQKGDWWIRRGGQALEARPELRQEMLERAGVELVMHHMKGFMKEAERHLQLESDPEVDKEVEAATKPESMIVAFTAGGLLVDPSLVGQAWAQGASPRGFTLFLPATGQQLRVIFSKPFSQAPLVRAEQSVRLHPQTRMAESGWRWEAVGQGPAGLETLDGFVASSEFDQFPGVDGTELGLDRGAGA